MAEKKHNFTRAEIAAGALVLASVAVLALFVAIIQGLLRPGLGENHYFATFSNTLGLRENAEVRFAGMVAGSVFAIEPDLEDRTKLRVTLNLTESVPINEKSVATVEQLTLTAERHLEITSGEADAELLPPGSYIPSVTKSGAFLDIPDLSGMMKGGEDLIGDLRKLLGVEAAEDAVDSGMKEEIPSIMVIAEDLRALLGVEEAEALEAAGERELPTVTRLTGDLREFLGVAEAEAQEAAGTGEFVRLTDITADVDGLFAELEPELKELLEDIDPIAASTQELLAELNNLLDANKDELEAIVGNVEDLTGQLKTQLEEMSGDLKAVLANANTLTGDAGDLLRQNRPVLEDMIGDLGVMIRNLNTFVGTLKNQPQSILWGRPEEGRKEK